MDIEYLQELVEVFPELATMPFSELDEMINGTTEDWYAE